MGILEIDRLAHRQRQAAAPTGGLRRRSSSTPRRPDTRCGCWRRRKRWRRSPRCSASCSSEHRLIREQLARVGRPEAADRLIALLAAQARDTAARLRDPRRTAVRLGDAAGGAVAGGDRRRHRRARARRHPRRARSSSTACCPTPARVRSAIGAARTSARRSRPSAGGSRAAAPSRIVAASVKEPRGLKALASLAREQGVGRQGSELRSSRRLPASRRQPLALSSQPSTIQASGLSARALRRTHRCCSSAAKAASARRPSPRRWRCGWRARIDGAACCCSRPIRRTRSATSFARTVGDTAARDAGRSAEPGRARARRGRRAGVAARGSSKARSTRSPRRSASTAPAPRSAPPELMDLAPPGIDELFGILSVVDARAGLRRHRRRHRADRPRAAAARDAGGRARVDAGAAAGAAEVPVAGAARPAGGGARRRVEVDPRADRAAAGCTRRRASSS